MDTGPTPEFISVINNFIENVSNTFPEYAAIIQKWCKNHTDLWTFCIKKYIPNRDNILSKNVSIFDETSVVDTEFLPHVHFKNLWQYDGISDHTKDAIWGYLRLTLVAVDTTEVDLDDCLIQVQELFSNSATAPSELIVPKDPESVGELPTEFDAMFGGVLGSIAKDLAKDLMDNPDYSCGEASSIQEAMSNIFSKPSNISAIFKKVSDKLDQKVTSGEINNSDIMRETSVIFNQMKDIPGLSDNIFKDIGNTLNQTTGASPKSSNIKDRLRKKCKKS